MSADPPLPYPALPRFETQTGPGLGRQVCERDPAVNPRATPRITWSTRIKDQPPARRTAPPRKANAFRRLEGVRTPSATPAPARSPAQQSERMLVTDRRHRFEER